MPQPSFQEQINAHTRAIETLQEEIQALRARVGDLASRVGALESKGPMRPDISPQFGPGHGDDS